MPTYNVTIQSVGETDVNGNFVVENVTVDAASEEEAKTKIPEGFIPTSVVEYETTPEAPAAPAEPDPTPPIEPAIAEPEVHTYEGDDQTDGYATNGGE